MRVRVIGEERYAHVEITATGKAMAAAARRLLAEGRTAVDVLNTVIGYTVPWQSPEETLRVLLAAAAEGN